MWKARESQTSCCLDCWGERMWRQDRIFVDHSDAWHCIALHGLSFCAQRAFANCLGPHERPTRGRCWKGPDLSPRQCPNKEAYHKPQKTLHRTSIKVLGCLPIHFLCGSFLSLLVECLRKNSGALHNPFAMRQCSQCLQGPYVCGEKLRFPQHELLLTSCTRFLFHRGMIRGS